MRAIKINAEKSQIEVIEWSTMEDLQKHLGGYVELVANVTIDHYDSVGLLVDEDAYYKDYSYCFRVKGYRRILAGNGLIVGNDRLEFGNTDIPIANVEDTVKIFNWT